MKQLISLAMLVGGCLVSSAQGADAIQTNRIQLRLEPTVEGCTFDRTATTTYRTGPAMISGALTVNCREDARPYRMKTTLSPFANITLDDGRSYAVKMYVDTNGAECGSVPLHSAARGVDTIGDGRVTQWSVCAKLKPLRGAPMYSLSETWPLQGALNISLADAENENGLPANASVMYVHFDHNSSQLNDKSRVLMDNVIGSIEDVSRFHIQLQAHTSLIGEPNYNHDLSIMRLMRVREYLIQEHGVKRRDTWGQAWGEDRPKAIRTVSDEATENRRVDIVFIPKDSATVPSVKVNKAERPLNGLIDATE